MCSHQHLLHQFHYCPVCGSSHFEINDFKSRKCSDCGFTFYLNSGASVVAVVLNAEGQLLVARRAEEPALGTLDLPGGFVDAGESLEEAVIREFREETGAEVTPERWLFSLPNIYRYSNMDIPTTDSFFLCRLSPQVQLFPADDVSGLLWLPLKSLQPELFGLDSIRRSIPMLQKLLS